MSKIPIHNAAYQSQEKIQERYLAQLSEVEDENAAQKMAHYLSVHCDIAVMVEKMSDEFGLARIRNVLNRWESSIFGTEQFGGCEWEPLEIPLILQDQNQDALLEEIETIQDEVRKTILDKVQELEQKMVAGMQQFGEELAGKSGAEIVANAHRLGCYCGMIEYIQEWQGFLEDEIGSMEIEELEYLCQMQQPLQEIYEKARGQISFLEVAEKAMDELLRNTEVKIIQREIIQMDEV